MKNLIYVPIIHMKADLGHVGEEIKKRGIAGLGIEVWKEHGEVVSGFWKAIEDFFDITDVRGFKIYQDGMAADGELGMTIVADGVKKGSKNYEIVAGLLTRGAVLVKTEDFSLLKKEYDRLIEIIGAKTPLKKIMAYLKYKLTKRRLLVNRDEFMAKRIGETLREGETGVLFVGAFHEVTDILPGDIRIIALKDVSKLRDYQSKFFLMDKSTVSALAGYLAAPVEIKFDFESGKSTITK